MSSVLSIRLDPDTKNKLDALAKSSRRSKSFLAAEAIAAYVATESWQLSEIEQGITDLDKGDAIAHTDVKEWLESWGKKNERRPPR